MQKLLCMLYVLLGFSVIVSLFGMVNTLVLSVFERTREIGMLRTIGTTRRRPRRREAAGAFPRVRSRTPGTLVVKRPSG